MNKKKLLKTIFIIVTVGMCVAVFINLGIAENRKLDAPYIIGPENGHVFNKYPRHTVLRWEAVPGAHSYFVRVQYNDGGWKNLITKNVGNSTGFQFDFIGAQQGRFHVCSETASRHNESTCSHCTCSSWHVFKYTK